MALTKVDKTLLEATGTADATTFLRGDGAWAEAGVGDNPVFTGTASEITPISSVDDSSIGNGKPGEITLKLKDLYWDIIHGKVSQYTHWLSPIQSVQNLTPSVAE